jgi:hypothetical protein
LEQVADGMLKMVKDAKITGDLDTLYKIGGTLGLEFELGWAEMQEDGVSTSAEEVVPEDDVVNMAWFTLRDTYIYFDTGRHKITGPNEVELMKLMEYIRKYLATFPQAELRFVITGYASPRWEKAAREGRSAEGLNLELADMRAHNTHNVLEQHRQNILDPDKIDSCSYETLSELSGPMSAPADQGLDQTLPTDADETLDAVGSAEALDLGKDPGSDDPEDRRVHIETLLKIDMNRFDF